MTNPTRTKCAHMRDNLEAVAVLKISAADSFVPDVKIQPQEIEICAMCFGWIHAVTAFGLPVRR